MTARLWSLARAHGMAAGPLVVFLSGLSMYVAAAVATVLFEHFNPAYVAWLRVCAGGLIIVAFLRPGRDAWFGRRGRTALLYGLATLAMNICFYLAINFATMGLIVALEFMGPIVVGAFSSRTVRDWVALVLAGGGVVCIAGVVTASGGSLQGILWGFGAAAMWAVYIVMGRRISTGEGSPLAGIGVGFTWASVLSLPLVLAAGVSGNLGAVDGLFAAHAAEDAAAAAATGAEAGANLLVTILMVAVLGLMGTVIPYGFDQAVLRLVSAATFSVLMAIMPLTACLVGFVALGQALSVWEIIGIGLVVVAVILKRN